MGMSNSKKTRRKAERAGKLNPEALRGEWTRKPHTQIQPNMKQEQRRSFCRKPGTSEGADFIFPTVRIRKASGATACASALRSACARRPA